MSRHVKLWVAAGLVASIGFGCNKKSGTAAAKEDITLVPKETEMIFMVNVPRMRNTPMWRKGVEQLTNTPEAKKELETFATKCKLDPTKHIDSAFVALPTSTEAKEFAVLIRGTFNQEALTACIKEQ